MKAVGYYESGEVDREEALLDLELPRPNAVGHDLLVQVQAVSVNPVDTKIRAMRPASEGEAAVLGWDAVGTVVALGDQVTGFEVGEQVWYAGAIDRPGTNAEYHLVDARIVGHAPKTASLAEAAALPLTTLTAWEMLFDRLRVDTPVPGAAPAVLIIGGAGGVGSIAIQLLRAKTDLTIIATASRPETQAWVKELGAHHVIDHRAPLDQQVADHGIGAPGFVFSTTHSDHYVEQVAELIAPQGRFGLIDDPQSFNILPLKHKAVSLHWEFMYTRSLFGTADIAEQGKILNETAALVDAHKIKSTVTDSFGVINAANLLDAHRLIESGTAKGKLVLEGF
ncbi:NADPH2:quinone reductase [Epibacterium ulvae]|uniref:Zinc-type alcohol dehydrogenase-like protein n=1 Tax=Epibacterium ulvae TaxID=1156985 RepID=A0A1G5R5K1_9RHOB|nr:zinc-binding alcohol dehydrogenase family protein [Epibacterium ulvae]SCZ69352.1 NADPH2:quinone reductase [Epibacterium ulvae]